MGHTAACAGLLAVSLERRHGGRTVIASQESRAPLLSQRAVYADAQFGGLASVCMMSSSGGIVQGDAHTTRIALGAGAQARITAQGATRVYGMDSGSATHSVGVSVGEGAYLEMLPGQLIPYAHSRYAQSTECVIDDSATVICSEIVTPGRVAMGESFMYDTCHLSMAVRSQDGRLRLADAARLEPREGDIARVGALGDKTVAGSAYILAAEPLAAEMCESIAGMRIAEGVSCGASPIHGGDGLTVRMLADRPEDIARTIRDIASTLRRLALCEPTSP